MTQFTESLEIVEKIGFMHNLCSTTHFAYSFFMTAHLLHKKAKRQNNINWQMSFLIWIPWAKSRINRKGGSASKWVGGIWGWINESACIRIQVPDLNWKIDILKISKTLIISTYNHYFRAWLECSMIMSRSGQVANIAPVSILIFSDCRCCIGSTGPWTFHRTTNNQNAIICWDHSIAEDSENRLNLLYCKFKHNLILIRT